MGHLSISGFFGGLLHLFLHLGGLEESAGIGPISAGIGPVNAGIGPIS